MKNSARKQLNLRIEPDLIAAIAETQRLDESGPSVPSMTEVIRRGVIERRNRLRDAFKRTVTARR